MKKRFSLLVLLMAACTLALVGLQGYWNVQAYEQATRTFRREANEALTEAVRHEGDQRQQALRRRYQHWLADTSTVLIRSRISQEDGETYFYCLTASRLPASTGSPLSWVSRATASPLAPPTPQAGPSSFGGSWPAP